MGFLVGIITGAFMGLVIGGCMAEKDVLTLRKQAIERGYAHQVITDSINGTTEFKWVGGDNAR